MVCFGWIYGVVKFVRLERKHCKVCHNEILGNSSDMYAIHA